MRDDTNRAVAHLRNILKYCEDIFELQKEFGASYESFRANKGQQYSLSFCVEHIGELTQRLRDKCEFDLKYPHIQWNAIAGMRNRIAHGYDSIDLDMVYQVCVEDIPQLYRDCQHMLLNETHDVDEKIALAQTLQDNSQTDSPMQKSLNVGREERDD